MIPVKNGQLRTFGGADSVTPELLDRLYSRMASWIRLLDSTMRAEFPSWEILSAFNVFDLGTKPSDAVISESLSCLAKAFVVNPGRLGGQFVDFKTFAQVEVPLPQSLAAVSGSSLCARLGWEICAPFPGTASSHDSLRGLLLSFYIRC